MKNILNFINNKILKNKKLWLVCATFAFLFLCLPATAHASTDPSGLTSAWSAILFWIFIGTSLISSLFTLPFYFYKVSKNLYFVPAILNFLFFLCMYYFMSLIFDGKHFRLTIILIILLIVPLIFACLCCFFACDKKIVSILFVIIPILLFIFFIEILSPQLKTMRINNIMKIIKTKNIDKFKNIKKNKKDKSIAKDYLYAQVERGDKTFFDFLSAEDINNYQLLYRAVYIAKRDMMQYFIEKGADVNVKYETGKTPLHLVENKEIVKLLIAKGANVNAKDNGGETPLHNASEEEIVELLIAKGANVNAKNNGGKTPLHYASYYKRHKKIVELLIAKGADVNAKDEDGRTPLDFAEDEKMKQLLISHGAKSGKDLK